MYMQMKIGSRKSGKDEYYQIAHNSLVYMKYLTSRKNLVAWTCIN